VPAGLRDAYELFPILGERRAQVAGRGHGPGAVVAARRGAGGVTQVASAWPRYPGYAIDLVPLGGIGRARVGDVVVAESDRCLLVRESDHRDQLYFPRQDVDATVLVDSSHHTVCPFKGEASYAGVAVAGTILDDVMWWYPEPMAEVAGLDGHVAFYDDHRVEVSASVPLGDDDEATARFPIWGTATDLAGLMDAVRADDGHFVAPPFPDPPLGTFVELGWHRQRRDVVEGGQLLGAAVVVAGRSRPDQRVASAHMVFVKAASFDEPVHLAVDARRRGRTLSAFDVRVEQAASLRATGLVMTDAGADDLIRHVAPMPDVPPPSACPRHDFGVVGREVRVVDGAYGGGQDAPPGPPELSVWTRFATVPDDPLLHLALLAQDTTHYSIGAALRAHQGVSEADAHRTISTGPVSATVAFHDQVDVTEWLLTETRSTYAGRGMTQSEIRVFAADGRLVASKAVQAIVRRSERTPEQREQGSPTVM
jgi:acyl-CoA thioesterase-2